MYGLIKVIWSLCQLKAGPQDLPHSLLLLSAVLILNFCLGAVQLIFTEPLLTTLWLTFILLVISATFTYLVLYLKGKTMRFLQTFTALSAVNLVINVLILPLIILQPWLLSKTLPLQWLYFFSFIYMLAFILANIWLIVITAHIYREALGVSYLLGLFVAFGFIGVNILAYSLLRI